MDLIRWMTIGIAALIPIFFFLKFYASWKRYFLGFHFLLLTGLVVSCHGSYDELSQMASLLMLGSSTVLVGAATIRRQKDSRVVFPGLLSCIVFVCLFDYDISLFLSFGVIIMSMLYVLAIRSEEQRQAYESSRLFSARLEIELIKKNIQPHFLLNTLTSLMDWVEESPQHAVRFIESLAEEFKILGRIADKKLISIEEEIALCKTHLNVMRYRNEINYQWEEQGIDADEMIPPALLHTALENGITHSRPQADGAITFRLSFERAPSQKKYALTIFGGKSERSTKDREGTGLRYMKARLQESYGSHWKLTSQDVREGWQTTFTIYNVN